MGALGIQILPRESWRSVDSVVEGASLTACMQSWKQSLGWDVIRKPSGCALKRAKSTTRQAAQTSETLCMLSPPTDLDSCILVAPDLGGSTIIKCVWKGESALYTLLCNAASFTQDYSFLHVIICLSFPRPFPHMILKFSLNYWNSHWLCQNSFFHRCLVSTLVIHVLIYGNSTYLKLE